MKLLLSILACSLSVASFACDAQKDYTPIQQQPQDAMLYRITDCDDATEDSFVFGTFHTSDQEVIRRIEYILPYLRASDTALFELTKDAQDATLIVQYMFLPADNDGLKSMLGEADFNALVALLEQSPMPIAAPYLDRYKPWAASVMAQISLIELSGEVVDDMLQRIAAENKLDVLALEDMKAQFEAFEVLTQEEQIEALRDTINYFDVVKKLNNDLKEAYLQQNLSKVNQAGDASFEMIENKDIAAKLEASLVIKRNERMVEGMLPHLQKGSAFTAVGALHLPKEHGILQLLENKGYYIYPVKQ